MKSIIDDCFSLGFLLRLVFGPFARLLLEFFNVRFGDSCSLLSFGFLSYIFVLFMNSMILGITFSLDLDKSSGVSDKAKSC